MSDRVQTAILWLQRIAQVIGVLLALLGGGQAAAVKLAPEAYGSAENITTAGENTLYGVLLMVLTPAVGWVVRTVYAKTRGKRGTPVADLVAGEAAVVTLETQLSGRAPDLAALAGLRKSLADVFAEANKPAPAPAPVVEAK